MKYTVKAIIDSEFPCTFTYPIVGYENPDIIIDPVTNDFEVISRPLPATPEEMFSITVHYECGRIPEKYGFSGNIVFIIKNGSKAELYDHIYIFSDKDRLTLLDKINKYLVIALELLTKGKQRDIEKLVEVFRILAKYIKLYVIENKKRGGRVPLSPYFLTDVINSSKSLFISLLMSSVYISPQLSQYVTNIFSFSSNLDKFL